MVDGGLGIRCILTHGMQAFGLKFLHLFHKLMNQYQACLYSFECISHGDSKYGYEIPKVWNFWTFCDIFNSSSAHACYMVSVKIGLLGFDLEVVQVFLYGFMEIKTEI